MHTRVKIALRQAVVIAAIMMLVSSALLTPVSAVSVPEKIEIQSPSPVDPKVHIYYDGKDPDMQICSIQTSRPLVMRGIDVLRFKIDSLLNLEYDVSLSKPDYAVYFFQSSQSGVEIGLESYTWAEVAEIVKDNPSVQHVFGVGSAYNLRDTLGNATNLHVENVEVIDIKLGVLYVQWRIADQLSKSSNDDWAETGEQLREDVISDFSDNINEYFSKSVYPETYTGERVPDPITDPRLTERWVEEIPQYDDNGEELQPVMKIGNLAAEEDYIDLRSMTPDSGVGGPMGWLIETVFYSLIDLGFQDLAVHVDAARRLNTYIMSVVENIQEDVEEWYVEQGFTIVDNNFTVSSLLPSQMFELWSLGDQLILDAWYEVDDYIGEFFERIINRPVQNDLTGLCPVFLFRLGTPMNLGSSFASFGAVLRIKLLPDFEIDKEPFKTFMNDAVFGDLDLDDMSDTETAFLEVRKFVDVIPVMDIDLGICAFLPTGDDWTQSILGAFTLDFFGYAHLQLAFPPVDASNTDRAFIDVREWGLRFELDASLTLTVSAFLGGAGHGVLSTILDWLSALLQVSITLTLSIVFEISKKYQGQGLPALSTLLLDIIVGVTLYIRLLIVIFRGTFKVGMRFEQRSGILSGSSLAALANDPDPVIQHTLSDIATSKIAFYITIYCSLYFAVDLFFTSWGTHFGGPWETTIELSGSWGSSDYGDEAADLTDSDSDGLPDAFEERMNTMYGGTYIDPASADTDGDGLGDKLELELNTAPNDADTDDDLLTDYEEHMTFLTMPLIADTDRDNLTDYEECITYGTSPFKIDTDGDMLYDWYEINTVYDVSRTSGSYGAVDAVMIGGVVYDDRTDPLNPDTDNDDLLDGEEGENGVQYANETMIEDSDFVWFTHTHPLDADTDDDSIRWEAVSPGEYQRGADNLFMWDMNDGVEILGQYATIPDEEGYPITILTKTNPCNADTDYDSGPLLPNTDGKELSTIPQTDPADGDTDNDGLLDGYEAIGPMGTGTSPVNPDTDNDGLPDYEDYILPTDQRDPDTDDDQVLDGDEYYKYGTNPILNDTDMDGLTDGEELFFFYCNPLVRDSDVDGLTDGEEVLIYLTDPLVADTDNDGLTDGYEVFYSHTDPRLWDTDNDRLSDGEELNIYNSNPLDWDSDHDSLDYPNENGSMTLPLSDGDEVYDYQTSPITIDTDADGLTDSQEIYLAMGYPGSAPIPLDPLNNDTDNDLLLDGQEMILVNVSIITYPYEALTKQLRYHSCPVLNDTDGDGLIDGLEVQWGTDCHVADTDHDNLNDYTEIYITHTNPKSNDTDGDELPDGVEDWNYTGSMTTLASAGSFALAQNETEYWPLYPTDVNDSDTDDDLLPDGLEIFYGTDPLNPDENNNGILDGYEYDFDEDGLSDGAEFYENETWKAPLPIGNNSYGFHWIGQPGGFDNPDSDDDGLTDGEEVHIYGTDPTSADTDGDGVSDGDEVAHGENPVVPITEGYPIWLLLGIAGGLGFIAGIVIPAFFRFTIGKVRGDDSTKKTSSSKKKGKSTKSKEGGKK